MRDSCIFYRSFFEAIKELPKENQADVYNAIFEHSLNFNEIDLVGINKTIMTLIKPQLDANIKRFENGKKPKQKQNESKTEANNNVNVNNNLNANENANEVKKKIVNKFTPPTILDVETYFTENGFTKELAKKAFEYYAVADWKDSKGNQVKNWKQKMRGVWFKDENKVGAQPVKKWLSPA